MPPSMSRTFAAVLLLAGSLACDMPGPSVTAPSPPTEPPPAAPPPDPPQHLTGLVSRVTGSCPSLTFQAGSRSVTTSPSTEYVAGSCADVRQGALLDVEGRESSGAFESQRVRLEGDGPADAALVSDVAAGGYVLFFRHAERDAGAIGTDELAEADNAGTCVPGSELTAAGLADSEALGQRFGRYGISVQRVYASPSCRTTQMARLAFGEFDIITGLLWRGAWPEEQYDPFRKMLPGLLATIPEPGKVIVLVSHNSVLDTPPTNVQVALDQSDAAVFRPFGGETFEYVGRIPKATWMGRR